MWPETDEPFVHIELAAGRIIEVLNGVAEEDEFRSDWKLQAVVERLLGAWGGSETSPGTSAARAS